ncbi:metalloregulator ArsR/SmtB family transcription factor [Intrasporangium calvum]|uniref:Metalloregulator ArsR/SmtB family transcription factor n=1 Tax=Intrasporangium calvum TaxID=53358 RepID=A0ABT5GKN9_9MICO|nr:metalloregulator ArsR/SmtB family transcription factor [Intrasporangium calvum]MDC5698460.1 metalloregulator ArsR/SmtB family transcription factor [Intrasporangium calvum]
MTEATPKDDLFAQFAAVGKALGHPKRLELLDLLAQGPRSVDDLARATGLQMSTCSAHLQNLREAGLLTSRREHKRVFYSLSGVDVVALWDQVRRVAEEHRPHTELARRAYLGPDDTVAVDTDELLARLESGDVVLLDVRPETEYAAGHVDGAIHIPLDELGERIPELPTDREVVAYCRGRYCVLAHDAVRLLSARGLTAKRAADGILEWRITDGPGLTS